VARGLRSGPRSRGVGWQWAPWCGRPCSVRPWGRAGSGCTALFVTVESVPQRPARARRWGAVARWLPVPRLAVLACVCVCGAGRYRRVGLCGPLGWVATVIPRSSPASDRLRRRCHGRPQAFATDLEAEYEIHHVTGVAPPLVVFPRTSRLQTRPASITCTQP